MSSNFIIIFDCKNVYTTHLLSDGSSALSRSIDMYKNLDFLEGSKTLIRINVQDLSSNLKSATESLLKESSFEIIDVNNTSYDLIEHIYHLQKKHEVAHTCITWADNMFQSVDLYNNIFEEHCKYSAHYTFAEGYPTGVSPELLSTRAIEMLYGIANTHKVETTKKSIERESIFSVVEYHINDFDIETVLASTDMRPLRISLTGDTRRNFLISKNLIEQGVDNPDSIEECFYTTPNLFRTCPNYIYAQVCNKEIDVVYKPKGINASISNSLDASKEIQNIEIKEWEEYLTILKEFAPEATLCVGYNGEVLFHDKLGDVLHLASQKFSQVYVETTGINWQVHKHESWWKEDWIKDIIWIVSIDAYNKEIYQQFYNRDNSEVLSFIQFLEEITSNDNIYIQAVRMNENEHELELFMSFWESKKLHVIIQKYNDFCKLLPSKKVVDISPVKRLPCHHLARDITILLDGSVVKCMQAHDTNHILGTLTQTDIETLWSMNDLEYAKHSKGEYSDMCARCDEYYTVYQ